MTWLATEDRDDVRWLTIDRPGKKNAVPMDGWSDLTEAFADFEKSPRRILVVTGAGGDFCSGADLDPARLDVLVDVTDRHRQMKEVGSAVMALHRVTKPTLAAVDGFAIGAGMNLALGCDIVVATTEARFGEIFTRRGLTLDSGGTWLLPRMVGLQRAKELALTGRMIGADEAMRIGLVMEVVEPDRLIARVEHHAAQLLAGAPVAQMFTKQMLNASFGTSFADSLSWEGEAQSIVLGTQDAAEGVAAFLERRDPEWRGR
jgi:enoyl-CoA hydratase/carnithine racemase